MPRTVLLNSHQVRQRINRLAWQVFEDQADEKEIVIVGILESGDAVAKGLCEALKSISGLSVRHETIRIDKHAQVAGDFKLSADVNSLTGSCVVLVDDVLNSGKTLFYALRPFLTVEVKKIRTVVLVDRHHRRFPVTADYSGLSLATTLKEHVSVESDEQGLTAYLD
ncbi:MAG: phosphoribosyltransferase family protein [Bacteroidota bacterium]